MVAESRSRRTCLSVPGSSTAMLAKGRGLSADLVFCDLEDSVAPLAKDTARKNVVAALGDGGWSGKTVGVRVNDWTTQWTYRDVIEVIEGAGSAVDVLILPKVRSADEVRALDLLISQLEQAMGLGRGRIGIEVQIEDARGLVNVNDIAASSSRLEALIFGPGDFMASVNMRSLVVGEQPPGYDVGDAYHYVMFRLLTAARAHGLQVIDGPYLQIGDLDGLRRIAGRAAALGFDGKWVLHPSQIELVNDVFSPAQDDYEHAELILEAYDWHTSESGGRRGAVMLGDEMIDEASRKMAQVIAAKGRASGLSRTRSFEPPSR